MTPEQIKELITRLLNTGEILASKAFELAYRQVLIEGWMNVILGGLFVIFCLGLALYIFRHDSDPDSMWENNGEIGVVALVVGFLGLVLAVVPGVRYLMNPAWYAAKLLLNTFIQ